jgi:hypothetical protein
LRVSLLYPLNNLGAQKLETSETCPGHANFKIVVRHKRNCNPHPPPHI